MRWLKGHLPAFIFRYIEYMKRDAKGVIGGYFLAQFRIMCVVALILAAGFLVLGVRYGVLLAFLTAILDFLPIFGTGTVLFPWAVVKLFAGEYAYATGLILLYILTQVVRQIIQPKIVGESMGLPRWAQFSPNRMEEGDTQGLRHKEASALPFPRRHPDE